MSRTLRRSPALAAAVLALGLLAGGIPGIASAPGSGLLSTATSIVRWTGAAKGAGYGPPAYTPQACALAAKARLCDVFSLDVELPAGTFTKARDGVFVAVRWSTDFDQWNLFVYAPNGRLAASGFDVDSNAQAVLIPHAANGVYKVVVVPFYMDAVMTYRGEARAFLDDTARYTKRTALLPQLQTVAPFDFHVACSAPDPTSTNTNGGCTDTPPIPSNPTGWRFGGGYGDACYADETVQGLIPRLRSGAPAIRRCLRFTNDIHNVGAGPLRLRLSLADALAGIANGPCEMTQAIDVAAGTDLLRPAGRCVFHRAHGHFHYQGFARYGLYRAPASDASTPPDLTKPPVSRAAKVGYCLIDVDFFGDVRNTATIWPRTNYFPNCNVPTRTSATASAFQEMGITRGWGDIYTWDLPGQFIDITTVPDGIYDVVSIANPLCQLAEAGGGKEMAATRIALHGAGVRVIGTFGPYPVPGCVPPAA